MNEEQIEEDEKMTVDYTEYASVSSAIASTLATIKEVEVTELEPLHNSIDTEAIDRLFMGNTNKHLVIKQFIGEYEIVIRGDGKLIISKSG